MGTRVLAIDDEEDIIELYHLILGAEGYDVISSPTVYTYPAEVERLQPDVIILDLLLGRENQGEQFFHQLKYYPATASIPLILCTAASEIEEKEDHFRELGATLLYKPFEITDLLETVQKLLTTPHSDIS